MSSRPASGELRADWWSDPRLRAPSAEVWTAMSEEERTREEKRILAVLDEYREDPLEQAERQRQEAERQREEAEQGRQEAESQIASARAAAAGMVLRQLADRGLAVTDEQRTRIEKCPDFERLLGWVARASSAPSAEDLLSS